MTWKQNKIKKNIDNFWLGFIPSVVLAGGLICLIFKSKYTTHLPFFEALWKFSKTGLLGNDLLASILPGFILIFVFTKLKKEKATIGAFVGITPFIILTFWLL
jgi:hypothetical protein